MSNPTPLARPARSLINDASDAIASARSLCQALNLIGEGLHAFQKESGNAVVAVANRALEELERATELLSASKADSDGE